MADFGDALDVVLEHEGGFSDDPADPGGVTNYGISLRWAKDQGLLVDVDGDGDVDAWDIRALNLRKAAGIYRLAFWEREGYGRIADQRVASKLFDTAVNMGPARAHRIAQRAAGTLGHPLAIDGVLGPKTIAALNACEPGHLLAAMSAEQAESYRSLIAKNPKLKRFERGWLTRAAWPLPTESRRTA